MKIGELAKRTGIPARMLRYYEQQGLIAPARLANGYRDYDEYLVDRAEKIQGLVDAGIPTRVVSGILPCLDKPQEIVVVDPDPELRTILVRERDRMENSIRTLTRNRDSIDAYLAAMDVLQP